MLVVVFNGKVLDISSMLYTLLIVLASVCMVLTSGYGVYRMYDGELPNPQSSFTRELFGSPSQSENGLYYNGAGNLSPDGGRP
jgi:hypothetical protein